MTVRRITGVKLQDEVGTGWRPAETRLNLSRKDKLDGVWVSFTPGSFTVVCSVDYLLMY